VLHRPQFREDYQVHEQAVTRARADLVRFAARWTWCVVMGGH